MYIYILNTMLYVVDLSPTVSSHTESSPEAEEDEGADVQLLYPLIVDGRSITVQVIQVHENRKCSVSRVRLHV